MVIYLRKISKEIASKRKIEWHSGVERQFFDLENDLENGKINKDQAVASAADILKIEKTYDEDYKRLLNSITL